MKDKAPLTTYTENGQTIIVYPPGYAREYDPPLTAKPKGKK